MGEEVEKAFSIAGKEMEKALKSATDKVREATTREPIACLSCREKNRADAKFCFNCGKKLKLESA